MEASKTGWRSSHQEPSRDALPLEDITLRTIFSRKAGQSMQGYHGFLGWDCLEILQAHESEIATQLASLGLSDRNTLPRSPCCHKPLLSIELLSGAGGHFRSMSILC